mgnify:CR=1 FL=1
MGFSENLRNELDYQGLQVKELSARTGISVNTLNKYRPGSSVVPTIDNALKIAQVLNVSLDYLATGSDARAEKLEDVELVNVLRLMRSFSKSDREIVLSVIKALAEKY